MFYHFLAPEENFIELISKCKALFLGHTSKLDQQSSEVFQKVQQIYTLLINMISYRLFIIDKSQNALQFKYCAELPPIYWPNHCSFYNYMSVVFTVVMKLDAKIDLK